jgi:hypothetical protein
MSDRANTEFTEDVADVPQVKVPSERFWRSLMIVALLFMPLQGIYFAFTYSPVSFILVLLDLPLCVCLALRLAFKTIFSKGRHLRWLVELLVFCAGFVTAFLVRESIFEPTRTLYFLTVKGRLDKFAEEVEQSVRKIDLIGVPREVIMPSGYTNLIKGASGVRFADGTILVEARSGNMGSSYMDFVYFEGDESTVVGYFQRTYSWIDFQRMNDHWYKTTHSGITMEALKRLPENQ